MSSHSHTCSVRRKRLTKDRRDGTAISKWWARCSSGTGSDTGRCTSRSRPGRRASRSSSSRTWSTAHCTCSSRSVTSPCRQPTWACISRLLRRCSGPRWTSTVHPGWTLSMVGSSFRSSTTCSHASPDITCAGRKSTSRSFATTSRYRT
jgi:hypothetical protein